jgi:hypothetical protein
MDLVPSPPQCPLLSELEMRDLNTLSGKEADDLRRQWERFLRHHVRNVILCEYHHTWLWTAMPDGLSQYSSDFEMKEKSFRDSSQLENCRLCDLFSEGPTPYRLWKMVLKLQQCHVSIGTTGWQPLAEIVIDGNAPERVFRIKFPGIEQTRGQKPRSMTSAHINYDLLSTWIKKCTQQHRTSRCQPPADLIPGLRLLTVTQKGSPKSLNRIVSMLHCRTSGVMQSTMKVLNHILQRLKMLLQLLLLWDSTIYGLIDTCVLRVVVTPIMCR